MFRSSHTLLLCTDDPKFQPYLAHLAQPTMPRKEREIDRLPDPQNPRKIKVIIISASR